MIGIGFTGPKVPLHRIPGWEPDSYAYHGDDGNTFSNSPHGKAYGDKFGTLDVIGCGVNFRTNTAFFTKNGQKLRMCVPSTNLNLLTYAEEAFRDLKPNVQYYPTVGMRRTNDTLRANFGQEPFAFDIDNEVQKEKALIQAEISRNEGRDRMSTDETQFIHSLIGQYLAHDGYVDTARAFAEEVSEEVKALADDEESSIPYMNAEDDIDATQRQSASPISIHTPSYKPRADRINRDPHRHSRRRHRQSSQAYKRLLPERPPR
jgi:hypothetical protein